MSTREPKPKPSFFAKDLYSALAMKWKGLRAAIWAFELRSRGNLERNVHDLSGMSLDFSVNVQRIQQNRGYIRLPGFPAS